MAEDGVEDDPGAMPLDSPGVASAEDGQVVLDGPDGVAITLTPDAAEQTAQSLLDAAKVARQQPG